MAGDKRTVEFLFRAKDEFSAIAKKVGEAFGGVAEAQEDIAEQLAKTNPEYVKSRDLAGQLAAKYKALKGTVKEVSDALAKQTRLAEITADLREQGAAIEAASAAQRAAAAEAAKASAAYAKQAAEVKQLKAEMDGLAARQKQLGVAAGVVEEWERLSAAMAELKQREAATKAEVDKLTLSLKRQQMAAILAGEAGASKSRDEEIKATAAAIAKLNRELSNAGRNRGIEQQMAALAAEMDRLSDKAQKAGIETADLLKPLDQLQAEAAAVGARIAETGAPLERMRGNLVYLGKASNEAAANLKEADIALSKAEGTYQRTAKGVNELRVALDQLEKNLKEAGVATDRLADEEVRLKAELDKAARSAKQQAAEVRKVESAAAAAANAQKKGFDLQRTSLSLTQRLRGQVLGLAAAYIGLYGAIDQVSKAFKTGGDLRAAENTLLSANKGDSKLVGEELAYAEEQAFRLGQEYVGLSKSYSKFRASVGDKATLNDQRALFESLTETASVLRLTPDELQGVFTAVNQIFAKGKISSEEFRQQFAERIPGAMDVLSKALGRGEDEIYEMFAKGQIPAENLLIVGEELRKRYGPGLANALKAPQAEYQRLQSVVSKLRVEFERAAEKAGLGEAIQKIANAMKDPKFKEGVQALGAAFVSLLNTVAALLPYIDKIALALGIFIGTAVLRWVVGLALAFKSAAVGAYTFAVGMSAAAKSAAMFVAKATGIIGALWLLYDWLTDFAKESPEAMAAIAGAFIRTWQRIQTAFKTGWSYVSSFVEQMYTAMRANLSIVMAEIALFVDRGLAELDKLVTNALNGLVQGAADIAESLRLDSVAAAMRKVVFAENKKLADEVAKSEATLTALKEKKNADLLALEKKAQEERDAIRREDFANEQAYQDALDALVARRLVREKQKKTEAAKAVSATQGSPRSPVILGGEGDKEKKRAEDQLNDLLEKVREQMNEISAEVARGSVDTLQGEFAAIEQEYAKLLEDIARLAAANPALLSSDEVTKYETLISKIKSIRQGTATKENARKEAASVEGLFGLRDQEILDRQQKGDITSEQALAEREALRVEMYQQRWLAAIEVVGAAEADLAAARATGDSAAIAAAEMQLVKEQQYAKAVEDSTDTLRDKLITADQVNDRLAQGLADTAMALGEAVANGESLSDAFKSAGDAFRSFAASFLRDIANMILKAVLLRAISGTGIGGSIAGWTNNFGLGTGVNHSGAVIGNGSSNRTRNVSPAWFANAQRFHSGGLPGLRADEVPAILQKGEEVLSKSNPRNILNGGAGAGGAAAPQRAQDIKIVNAIDSGSVMAAGMDTVEGQRAILNFVRANKSTFKSVLN